MKLREAWDEAERAIDYGTGDWTDDVIAVMPDQMVRWLRPIHRARYHDGVDFVAVVTEHHDGYVRMSLRDRRGTTDRLFGDVYVWRDRGAYEDTVSSWRARYPSVIPIDSLNTHETERGKYGLDTHPWIEAASAPSEARGRLLGESTNFTTD